MCLQNGYTQFKPRFMVQHCLEGENSANCQNSCINKGRYCAMDTIAEDLQHAYKGRNVRFPHVTFLSLPVQMHSAALLSQCCDGVGCGGKQEATMYQAAGRGTPSVLAVVVLCQAIQPELQVVYWCALLRMLLYSVLILLSQLHPLLKHWQGSYQAWLCMA